MGVLWNAGIAPINNSSSRGSAECSQHQTVLNCRKANILPFACRRNSLGGDGSGPGSGCHLESVQFGARGATYHGAGGGAAEFGCRR
jgi:hypothetical protein